MLRIKTTQKKQIKHQDTQNTCLFCTLFCDTGSGNKESAWMMNQSVCSIPRITLQTCKVSGIQDSRLWEKLFESQSKIQDSRFWEALFESQALSLDEGSLDSKSFIRILNLEPWIGTESWILNPENCANFATFYGPNILHSSFIFVKSYYMVRQILI